MLEDTRKSPVSDLTAVVKFFFPDCSWTWYAVAWDGDDTFFGLVDGIEAELGYWTLSELLATRGKLGCAIERDRQFRAQPLLPIFERALDTAY